MLCTVWVRLPPRAPIFSVRYVLVWCCISVAARTLGSQSGVPVLLAILATTLVGALDEGIQAILPSRVVDPLDMLFNFLAAVMAVTASATLRWARRLA